MLWLPTVKLVSRHLTWACRAGPDGGFPGGARFHTTTDGRSRMKKERCRAVDEAPTSPLGRRAPEGRNKTRRPGRR